MPKQSIYSKLTESILHRTYTLHSLNKLNLSETLARQVRNLCLYRSTKCSNAVQQTQTRITSYAWLTSYTMAPSLLWLHI